MSTNIKEDNKKYDNYSWDDLRIEIMSIVALFQDQYLLISSHENMVKIIHFDSNTDHGLRNSNTITITGKDEGGDVNLNFQATSNLNKNLGIGKPLNASNSISGFIELLNRSFEGELHISKKYSSNQNEKLFEIENQITSAKNQIRFNRLTSLVLLGFTIAILFMSIFSFIKSWDIWVKVLFIVLFILLLIFAIGFAIGFFTNKSELENLQSKKNIISGLPISSEDKKEYFERLLQINIENLDSYYRMVKLHTAQSFRVSLMLSSVGILLITVGLVLGFQKTGDKTIIAYISSSSGVLIEIISGLLFYLYNKAVRQLKDYHDSLINAQNIFLSFRLIEPIDNGTDKVGLITKMIDSLSKRADTNLVH